MKSPTIASFLAGGALIATTVFTGLAANATVIEEPCTPSDGVAAYDETIIDSPEHWQRYSAKGSWKEDFAPDFPGDIWQANVAGDPHGIGVAGAYSVSNENSGNVDWFYLELVPAETHVVHHDAVDPVVCEEDPETFYDIGLYCYTKVDPSLPASWENSGYQTLVAVKEDSAEDWTLEEKRDLCDAPEESCDPGSIASQSDWAAHEGDFTFPEHVEYPVDPVGWPPLYNAVHTDLTQVLSDDCEEEVLPKECVSTGAWGTESDDTAPVQTADGLVFTGGSGDAVGYGTVLTGNLQGLPEITVSATGDLDVFYSRIVINSLADGGWAYDSLTVVSEGPVNGSSIAASNKRDFIQHTLDEWAALLPNNSLVAFFLHLDSGATADQSVTVTSVDSTCFSLDLVPEYPGDLVEETEWVDGKPDCGDTTVEQTRTVVTKQKLFVEGEWVVESEADWFIDEQTQPRALSPEELKALAIKCLSSLAYTGNEGVPLFLGGAASLLLLGAASIFFTRKRTI